jgi:hypothetical protein
MTFLVSKSKIQTPPQSTAGMGLFLTETSPVSVGQYFPTIVASVGS